MDRAQQQEIHCHVIDVPSRKLRQGKDCSPTNSCNTDDHALRDTLHYVRRARRAKKRLLYFPVATRTAASICYAATEASEKDNMQEFFERHFCYEKHTIDQCSMVHNSWETELHLSYYQLLENSHVLQRGIPPPQSEPFPGGCGKRIARTSVGFRFNGDLFDRFWTCYMVEYTQVHTVMDPHHFPDGKEYFQRKVLEQYYFAKILTSLTRSTADILTEVKDCLHIESRSFSTPIPSNTAYTSWCALWQDFEPVIQSLEDDLETTKITIDQWESREEDRGQEKPRWTRNDERKYRAEITRICRDVKRQTRKLEHLQADIKSLRESCSNGLVRAREELSFRSEQNIATFTYVTVVFLPIGFTASIFSMSGSPESSLAIKMVIASVIALAVTILALMNAKGLAGVLQNIATSYNDLTAKAKQSSVMIRDRKVAENKAIKSNPGDRNTFSVRISSTDAMSWNLIFWTRYIFMELPSRSITAACRTLGLSRNVNKDLEGLNEPESILARGVVASGLLYCLVSGMAISGKEAAVVSRRSSIKFRLKSGAQLFAEGFIRVTLAFFIVPIFLLIWILQILCFNAWDAVALLGGEFFLILISNGGE